MTFCIGRAGWAAALTAALAAATAGAAWAQTPQASEQQVLETFDGATPLATFEGGAVTLGELIAERAELGDAIGGQYGDDIVFQGLLERMIRRKTLATMATREGVAEDPSVARRLAAAREEILSAAYLESVGGGAPTEEDLRAYYDTQAENLVMTRSRHILVATEDEAKAVKAELDAGADFATLAAEKSTGPSASGGGDLGFQGPGALVPPYEAAAAALEIGGVSDPVQTRFGWHVIKVEERQPMPFEQVRQALAQRLSDERELEVVTRAGEALGLQRPESRPPFEAINRIDLIGQ